MRPVSDTFLATLRDPHSTVARVDLLFPGETEPVAVPVIAGQVTCDRSAQHRRVGQITIPWSLAAGADLGLDVRTLSMGGYAVLYRGVRYGDGTEELVKLGTLRVESVTWQTLAAEASLELADRMAQVRDEPFTAPYAAAGKTATTAAVEIVQGVFGDTITYWRQYETPAALGDVYYSGDRAEALSKLTSAVDAEAFFDADGDFVFARSPSSSDPVVWMVDAGERGVMVDAAENLDRTGIYNGVLVQGQADGASAPFSALATFDDPASPIRWAGPFGKVALMVDSTAVADQQAAAALAQSLLALRLKQTRTLDLRAAPNPALEAGDTIDVVFADGRIERHLIDAVATELGGGQQTIHTRTLAAPGALEALPATDRLFYGRQAWRELQGAILR